MKKKKIISFVIIGFIAVAVLVADLVANNFSEVLTQVLCKTEVDDEAIAITHEKGSALAKEIEGEGAVLVENRNNTLPLDKSIKNVNVFGHGAVDWIISGSGSGQVKAEDDNEKNNIDFLKALTNYGITYNTELTDYYLDYQAPLGIGNTLGQDKDDFYVISEPSISEYRSELLENAKKFSDTAIVVISRRAGEPKDPTKYQNKTHNKPRDNSRTYLEISVEEETMLNYVASNFKNTIVLINSTNVMELSFMKTIHQLDSCLVVGATGTKAASVIPEILYGDINPSGKLADTYAYDLSSNINYHHVGFDGNGYYTNSGSLYPVGNSSNAGTSPRPGVPYMDYIEGIYVGYRWYETADVEGIFDDVNNEYGKGYEGVVQYPFGYGLSYTSFDWEVLSIESENQGEKVTGTELDAVEKITFTVNVKNIGEVAGKDVVELFFTAPYYSNEIEKSSIVLVDFAKTALIKPGDYQTLTLSFYIQDLASYDCYDKNNNGFSGYELDKGDYSFKLSTSSHDVKDVTISKNTQKGEFKYTLKNTKTFENDRITGNKVSNLFTGKAAEGPALDGKDSNANIDFISRSKFPKTAPTKKGNRELTDSIKEYNLYAGKNYSDRTLSNRWDNATEDIFGNRIDNGNVTFDKNNNLKIARNGTPTDLGYELGSNYDDPRWESVLEQVSINECVNLVSHGIYGNSAVDSIGKPALHELDGPNQLKGFSSAPRGTGFPCTFVIAQTWNKRLAHDFGISQAGEMQNLGLDGWYGPGCNIHRSPFEGRNYEYFSEDAILSGKMVNQVCLGAKHGGAYSYLKHLGFYEQESERDSLACWLTEQTLREIYFKPFQIAVEEGKVNGIMTAYGRIGAIWAGGCEAALTGILRNEWGFEGGIITDWSDNNEYMLMDQALRAGGDLGMSSELHFSYSNSSNRVKRRLKEAVKNITYMWLNSCYAAKEYAANPDNEDAIVKKNVSTRFVWWVPLVIDLNLLIYSSLLIWGFFLIRKPYEEENKED